MLSITQEQFDSLLSWLSSDREFAGKKYETIRAGLVRIFVSKGFNDAEDLADETIDRVITRLPDIRETYEGEPTRYFHGVARNVIRETARRKEVTIEVSAVWVDPRPTTEEHECLEHCLQLLPKQKRDLILEYLLYEGHQKIEHHKQMATELGITEGALRGRVHQIRIRVEDCVRQCAAGNRVTKLHPKTIVNRSAIGGGGEPSINSETIN
jgi:DNA-directed RNA polymerase specialized sigma24 family protein